jgi:hypothetical protein
MGKVETFEVGELVAVWSGANVRRARVVQPCVPHHCDKVRVRMEDGARLERVVFAETVQRLSGPEAV